ncbi:hypothetical protein C8J43_104290 [Sphingomonas sp. PP-CE-1G-424]|nr:hypothetical protein C8J43_104290 [Sphingomonas sp. PP-CE-1G-424]
MVSWSGISVKRRLWLQEVAPTAVILGLSQDPELRASAPLALGPDFRQDDGERFYTNALSNSASMRAQALSA